MNALGYKEHKKEFHILYSAHCNSIITIQTNTCIKFY